MARKWFKIGSGIAAGVGTISALLYFLVLTYGFVITGTDDICAGTLEDPCISLINMTNPNVYDVDAYNQNDVHLEFSPEVKEYYLFRKDGRCRGGEACAAPNGISLKGWNFIDFSNDTKPVANKAYVFRWPAKTTKEFLLWGLKNNPNDRVKWTINTPRGDLDPVWDGVGQLESGEYAILQSCVNYTKYNLILRNELVWSEKNQTNEMRQWEDKKEYIVQTCTEIGVKVGSDEISYKQNDKECLRTGKTLCCWLRKDGGVNVEGRKGSARTTILSGESGTCIDLEDNLKIISAQSDHGGVSVK